MSTLTTLKVINDRILVKQDEKIGRSKGGIILPDQSSYKPATGTVVGLGRGLITQDGKILDFSVRVGDRIHFESNGGYVVEHNEQEYLVIRENCVLAIERKEE